MTEGDSRLESEKAPGAGGASEGGLDGLVSDDGNDGGMACCGVACGVACGRRAGGTQK